jgi:hypothetical protein
VAQILFNRKVPKDSGRAFSGTFLVLCFRPKAVRTKYICYFGGECTKFNHWKSSTFAASSRDTSKSKVKPVTRN